MTELTQNQADILLKYPKEFISSNDILFPTAENNRLKIPLRSSDGLYEFFLDITRTRLNLYKVTYQNRYTKNIILARLDLNGPNHRNPDGTEVGGNHLHLYNEKYGDKFAVELPEEFNSINSTDLQQITLAFMKFCNIIKAPNFIYKMQTGDIFNEYDNKRT